MNNFISEETLQVLIIYKKPGSSLGVQAAMIFVFARVQRKEGKIHIYNY